MRLIFIACLGAVLAGCASPAPAPTDRYYRFADPQTPETHPGPPILERLAVAELRASGLYAERAMLFSTDAERRRLEQYHYDFWLDSPSQLLQRRMIAYFRGARVASQVVPYGAGLGAYHLIGGRIDCFEQQVGSGPHRVVVCLELYLKQPGKSAAELSKRYDATVSVKGDDMEDVVRAYEQAIDQILEASLRDIAE